MVLARSLARLFLASFALAVLSGQHAQAGPITWSYSSSAGSVPVVTDLMPPGGGHGVLSLTGAPSFTRTGSGPVQVIIGSSFQIIEPGNGNFNILHERTGVEVVVTDAASGLSRSMGWEVQVSGVPDAPTIELLNADPWGFDLGKNRYTVTPVDGTTTFVEVAAVATPEPSTLILAVLSIIGGSLAACRRRRRVLSA